MRATPSRSAAATGSRSAALATVALLLTGCGGASSDVTGATGAAAAANSEDAGAPGVDADALAPAPEAAAAAPDADADPAAAEAPSAGASAVPASAAVLAWETVDLDGTVVRGVDFAGQDVVLWMWAPWCSICAREAPAVATVAAEFAGQVQVVGVAGRDETPAHRAFVTQHGLEDVATVVDPDGSLWAAYGVSYQPAWVFIDEDGEAQLVPGALGEDQLRELMAALVAA